MAFFDLLCSGRDDGRNGEVEHLDGDAARPAVTGCATTARIPRTKPVTDPKTAASSPTGTPVAPEAAGMLRHGADDGQLIARKHDKVIQVRFTNPGAMGPRAMGWKPKPMDLKSKTITPLDRKIGAPDTAHDAAVGLFEPKLPNAARCPTRNGTRSWNNSTSARPSGMVPSASTSASSSTRASSPIATE